MKISVFFWIKLYIYIVFALTFSSANEEDSFSSAKEEDLFLNDNFIKKKYDIHRGIPKNPYYFRKYLHIKSSDAFEKKREKLKEKIILEDMKLASLENDYCPFLNNCSKQENTGFFSEYYCFDFVSRNVTDIFKNCYSLAVFLKIKDFVETTENNSSKNNGTGKTKPSTNKLPIDGYNDFFKDLFPISKACSWTNEHDKLTYLQTVAYEFKSRLNECLAIRVSQSNTTYFDAYKEKKDKLFKFLFPSSPAINSLLATFYISGPPNFILAFIPYNINTFFLNILVAFAVGTLFGDVFLHLLPQIFLGKENHNDMDLVLFNEQKNVFLSFIILFGFICFMLIDIIMRLSSKHFHNCHKDNHKKDDKAVAVSTSVSLRSSDSNDVKKRIIASEKKNEKKSPTALTADTSKITFFGYLNLIADFFHNFTDGLALFMSFHISPITGATTTTAIFFHEIPHEIGDFAILIQSGFKKYQALRCQFITAIGAFLGTLTGIFVQKFSKNIFNNEFYLFNVPITVNDLILPFITGKI
ncbi:Zn(2+) transporter YKE4 [Pneumocystis jirovecii RU7]|uniref:Uncharacterized protein n=1 Tax=Pneumocystis jirovecii (strain RU7) TaxID=1408657 RepID=A0A0W4ZD13_PNEJ7|nr:Zn(2+) transporter YKE4 [Pneumocystis jirovecii RU7]KTW26268.1 hypothetical protein T551_03567 [Pneumocystis jirovecii RU7]